MHNIKNLIKILIALSIIGVVMFIAFFAFALLLAISGVVAVTFYVRSFLPSERNNKQSRDKQFAGKTYHYNNNDGDINGATIEGEIVESEITDDIK